MNREKFGPRAGRSATEVTDVLPRTSATTGRHEDGSPITPGRSSMESAEASAPNTPALCTHVCWALGVEELQQLGHRLGGCPCTRPGAVA